MNLIDLYVAEVGQNLPGKIRADIEAEIRSLIQDTLEGRSQAAGRDIDDEMIVEVLKEFGPPAKMAASYMSPRYLIGPRLFPTFMLVIRIVAILLVVAAMARLGAGLMTHPITLDEGVRMTGQAMADLMTSLLAALGNIVFIFAVVEWAMPKFNEKKESWDPRTMKARQEPEPVHPVLLIWGTAMTALAILVFNVYPQWIGIYMPNGDTWTVIPVLTDAFFRLMPIINVQWVLQILLFAMLLRSGEWTTATRWFRIGLRVLGILILVMIITGDPIVNLQIGQVMPVEALRRLEPLAYTGFRSLMGFIAAIETFEVVKSLYQMMVRKTPPVMVG